ncbi:MAG: hypothetical protein K6F81_01270, partial [Acholeplasmatales bacterium]|nr:hypothetical protein [Acholeplasmatales bacterium]
EYCDITVNSGLETDEFECQTYTVLKGTTINIPGLIYDYDEKANSNYLIKWKMNDTFYYEGDSVLVDDSLTFTGFWSSEPNYEEKVKNVIDNIDKIGTVEYSKESYDKISNARNLYDALTDELKEGVTNYETLSNAEETYYNLANTAKSNEIIALIDSIGEVKYPDSYQAIINARFSYTVLNSVQKELVTNYETLLAAEEAYANLENTYKANTVIDLIDQIGELTATTECLVKIESAYEAYYDLTSAQRKLVTNYETLINAIDGYYNLVNQSMANVTIGLIESIGEVKYPDSYQAITSARSSYNSLNNVQKQLVTNYDVLKNAEATYKTLLNDYNLAINAITLIDNIGEVSYPSSLKPIMDATMAYNSLTDSQKNLVTNHDELVAKQEQFNQLLSEDISLIENTIYFIDSIKTVVYPSSLSSIKSARKLYDSLNDSQKERVTNYDVLVQAEQAYDYLEKEYLKAKDVMDKISALSDISYTTEYEAKLADARQSYDNLTDGEKSLVTNYDLLESSEKNYLKLDNVYNKIELIGEVSYTDESYKLIDDAYDAYFYLNDELQNLIPNKDKLEAAINKYAILKVTALINNIGEVKYPDSKSLISDARTAYDLLSSGLKTSVENYDTLLNAESKYSELLHEYYKQATDVIDLINNIGEVKYPTSYNQIEDARNAYDGLSIDQKSLVTNYETLTSAEEAYDELEKNYKEDSHIAGTVTEKIYNILKEEYGVEREIAIKDAEESYNELTDTQKPLVTNYYLLIINKNTYNTYKDVSSAQKVIDRIDLIGTVVYSQSSLDLIENARFSYDTITDIQKTLVSNYSALEAAEATYAKLKVDYENALNVEASINGIGDISYTAETKEKIDAARSGYNNLTDDQKALVTNYKVLETSENTYSSLEVVYNKIEEIGEVTYQKETKDKIDAARNAYDSLEDGLKEKITNYAKLLSAEEAYNKLDSEHTFRTI